MVPLSAIITIYPPPCDFYFPTNFFNARLSPRHTLAHSVNHPHLYDTLNSHHVVRKYQTSSPLSMALGYRSSQECQVIHRAYSAIWSGEI